MLFKLNAQRLPFFPFQTKFIRVFS
jgi:hypothetical protein